MWCRALNLAAVLSGIGLAAPGPVRAAGPGPVRATAPARAAARPVRPAQPPGVQPSAPPPPPAPGQAEPPGPQVPPRSPPPPAALDVVAIQKVLVEQKLDGWLLYDFRGQNPIAQELVAPRGHQSRRWFVLVPQKGEPVRLVHKIEAANFAALPGRALTFASWKELEAGLREALKGRRRIAMEYVPKGQIAALSRVDAGTVELVRSLGVQVVSSGDLVQVVKARWSEAGHRSHLAAARAIEAVKDEAFAFVVRRVREGRPVTEWDVADRIGRALDLRGFEGRGPIVAIGRNAADPHYFVTEAGAAAIHEGDLLLLDITARGRSADAVCADQTWMGFVGAEVPERFKALFDVVRRARDAAVDFLRQAHEKKKPVHGYEVDDVARGVVTKAGHGAAFLHRTGHSIDTHCHGDGANLDDFESRDERVLAAGVGFSVEPGIYLPGDVGLRSEIDVYLGPDGVEVTTSGVQSEIRALLAPSSPVGAPPAWPPAPTTPAAPMRAPGGDAGRPSAPLPPAAPMRAPGGDTESWSAPPPPAPPERPGPRSAPAGGPASPGR